MGLIWRCFIALVPEWYYMQEAMHYLFEQKGTQLKHPEHVNKPHRDIAWCALTYFLSQQSLTHLHPPPPSTFAWIMCFPACPGLLNQGHALCKPTIHIHITLSVVPGSDHELEPYEDPSIIGKKD